jgi:hypothetical protein
MGDDNTRRRRTPSDDNISHDPSGQVSWNGIRYYYRNWLTKLRISAHRLHIETGRYQGIPPHHKLCGQCDLREVKNLIHFLLCCSKFREERQQLFRTISQSCNIFLQLNPQENFHCLMTCEDLSILKELCHFIYKYCR